MKKLLSILAAVGLTATASSAVVACSTTISSSDVKLNGDTVTFTAKNVKMNNDYDNITDLENGFGVFTQQDISDKLIDGFSMTSSDSKITKFEKGKEYDFQITFSLKQDSKVWTKAGNKTLDLNKPGTKVKCKFGTIKDNDKENPSLGIMDKELFNFIVNIPETPAK